MTDGRKINKPPVRTPYLTDEAVAVVDQMWAMGVTQVAIGRHFEIHPRTVMKAINRTEAYARIPTSEAHALVLAQRSQPAIRFMSKAKRNAGGKPQSEAASASGNLLNELERTWKQKL